MGSKVNGKRKLKEGEKRKKKGVEDWSEGVDRKRNKKGKRKE